MKALVARRPGLWEHMSFPRHACAKRSSERKLWIFTISNDGEMMYAPTARAIVVAEGFGRVLRDCGTSNFAKVRYHLQQRSVAAEWSFQTRAHDCFLSSRPRLWLMFQCSLQLDLHPPEKVVSSAGTGDNHWSRLGCSCSCTLIHSVTRLNTRCRPGGLIVNIGNR